MSVKVLRNQLLAAIAMVLVAALALGSSTFAWFVTNTQVTASKVDVTASTAYNLLISDALNGNYGSTMALDPNEAHLTQVSTLGDVASTGGKAVTYDETKTTAGEVLFVTSDHWTNYLVDTWKSVTKNSKVTDPKTNQPKPMYYTDTAYLKSATTSTIYLDKAGTGLVWTPTDSSGVEGNPTFYTFQAFLALNAVDNAGNKDAVKAYNTRLAQAQALLKTMRVGFRVTQTRDNGATDDANKFNVYALAANNSYIKSNSISVNTSTGDADGFTEAIGQSTEGTADSAIAAYSSNKVTNFSNTIKVLTDEAMATGNGSSIATVANTVDKIADVQPNEQVQVDIYMWMEGCDYDTVAGNISSFADANITGIQFGFCLGSASNP